MTFPARFRFHPLVRGFAALMIATTIATSAPFTAFAQTATDAAATADMAATVPAAANAAPAAANTSGNPGGVPAQTVACQDSGLSSYFTCPFASFTIMIIAALIGVVTTIMYYSDDLFSYAITSTIVDFNTWYSGMQQQIGQIWGIFRDLANILIIGLFVFIAISIILGLQEYGQRRLIARVIIVAILINFSFLFTIIVINTSNLFATQIYSAIVQPSTTAGGSSTAAQGVGQQLATYMGLGSIHDTRNLLMTQYNSSAGLEAVFLHAFFLTVFAIGAIGVFLYASFLLFARFIVLILLLILSAAAFASYLSPGWAESGWSRWWASLLRNAFFAPVFMLFLLATVNLAQPLAKKGASGSGGTLGAFAAGAPSSGPWDSAFVYIAILGLFFGGIMISHSLAGGIARRMALVTGATTSALGFRGMGIFGRGVIGRGGMAAANAINSAQRTRREEGREVGRLRSGLENVLKGAGAAAGRRSFDPMANKSVFKAIAGAGGLTFGDQKLGAKGREGQIKEKMKQSIEAAHAEGHPSSKQVREEAEKGFVAAQKRDTNSLGQQNQRAQEQKQQADAVHTELVRAASANEKAKQDAQAKLDAVKNTRAQQTAAYDAARQKIEQARTEAQNRSGMARDFAMAEVKKRENELIQSKAELDTLDTNVAAAEAQVAGINAAIAENKANQADAQQYAAATAENARRSANAVDAAKSRFVSSAIDNYSETGVARRKARTSGFGISGIGNAAAAKITDETVKKLKDETDLKETMKHLQHQTADHGDDHGGGSDDHGGESHA